MAGFLVSKRALAAIDVAGGDQREPSLRSVFLGSLRFKYLSSDWILSNKIPECLLISPFLIRYEWRALRLVGALTRTTVGGITGERGYEEERESELGAAFHR